MRIAFVSVLCTTVRAWRATLFFFNDTATTEIYTLSLHDALPICGAGGLSMELLKHGAQSAIGLDLSPRMIVAATELAQASGFESRAKFQEGNAATAELPRSDIVVMDKVLCCYSEWRPLLKNAMEASNVMVGFSVPRDEGITKLPFRIALKVANYFQRRRGGALFYLHPLGTIDKSLQDAGFKRSRKQGSRLWLVFLYFLG